jgi:prepilin-type N-terminal cleavage/methylation domain-containing protein
MNSACNPERGFTLVEVLIASAVAAIVAAAAAATLRAVSHSRRAAEAVRKTQLQDVTGRVSLEVAGARALRIRPDELVASPVRPDGLHGAPVTYRFQRDALVRSRPRDGSEPVTPSGGAFGYYTEDGAPAGSPHTAARIVATSPSGEILFSSLSPYRVQVGVASRTRRYPQP